MSENTEEKRPYQEKPGGPFAKGNPGKPVGARHMTTRLIEAITAVSDEKGTSEDKEIVKTLVKKAKDGDPQAMKLIFNYIDGMPTQSVNLAGHDGGQLSIKVEWK